MSIWALETGVDFTQFDFPLKEDKTFFYKMVKNYLEDSKPVAAKWRTLTLLRGKPMKHPDFFEIDETDVIAISQKAIEIIEPSLNQLIELLPIETDAGQYFALNVLNIVDCLNKDESIYVGTQTGVIVNYTLLEFDEEKVNGHAIFKIPELPYQTFISHDIQELCEDNFLQGLIFDPKSNLIWFPE